MPIIASAVLFALAVLAYLRHIRSAGWLLVLRLAVLGLLATILADWVVAREWSSRPKRVVKLVDVSASMQAGGVDTLATAGARGLELAQGLVHEYWEFGDSAVRGSGETPRQQEHQGPDSGIHSGRGAVGTGRTRLGRALDLVSRTRPGAVFIFSDGQDNGDADPVRVAREQGIPCYTVGYGREGERNLKAAGITAPAVVYAGDTAGVYARIRHSGTGGEEVRVRMDRGYKQVRLGDGVAEQELHFRVLFDRPGRRLVRLAIDSIPGESDYADNVLEAVVEVRPSRMRVAYVTNRPGPGTRLMLRILEQNPRIEVLRSVPVAGPLQFGSELDDADVYLLDGVSAIRSGAGFWQRLEAEVQDGAGLLVLAGPDFDPSGLARLLPGAGTVTRKPGPAAAAPTGYAQVLSWLAEIDYDVLTPFAGVYVPDTAAQADVWLTAGDPAVPAVVSHAVGSGKVVLFGGYPVWRWGFGSGFEFGSTTPLAVLLEGLLRFLAEARAERFQLETDQPSYFRGEQVRLVMKATAPDGSAWEGLDVLVGLDSAAAEVPMVERGAGVYEAVLPAVSTGSHEAFCRVMLGDTLLGEARTGYAVSDLDRELSRTGLNQALLAGIAEASGGSYSRWDSLPESGFEPELAVFKHRFRFEPRRTWWLYALLALLVGLELVLRRRRGLL